MNKKKLSRLATSMMFALCFVGINTAVAQRGSSAEPVSARDAAPFDITGYWVSVVSEDWRWRMLDAEPGDALNGIPLNQAGRELAEAWVSEDGMQSCLTFGGAGIIRYPGRLHIDWEDDDTLRIDFSAGEQTRLLHFNNESTQESSASSLQGDTRANWYKERQTRGLGFGGPVRSFDGGNLRSVTSNLQAAFLQRNGIPYSNQATIEDFYKVIDAPNGDRWLIITSVVTDPVYLQQHWITSTNFKYEENGDNWNPISCR